MFVREDEDGHRHGNRHRHRHGHPGTGNAGGAAEVGSTYKGASGTTSVLAYQDTVQSSISPPQNGRRFAGPQVKVCVTVSGSTIGVIPWSLVGGDSSFNNFINSSDGWQPQYPFQTNASRGECVSGWITELPAATTVVKARYAAADTGAITWAVG
jgi:hypothetical protein